MTALFPHVSVELGAGMLHTATGEAVVVTLGGQGCFYLENDSRSGYAEAEPVEAVDTIGAGDAHTGAFISGLAGGFL